MPYDLLATPFLCNACKLSYMGPFPPNATCNTSVSASCIDHVLTSDGISCIVESPNIEHCVPRAPHSAVVFHVAARPSAVTHRVFASPTPFPSQSPPFLALLREFSKERWGRAVTRAGDARGMWGKPGLLSEHLRRVAEAAPSWANDAKEVGELFALASGRAEA